MKTTFLFPHKFKKLGWFLFLFGIILFFSTFFVGEDPSFFDAHVFALSSGGILNVDDYFKIIPNNLYNEIISVLLITGGLLTAFSKEKNEDEYIEKIRLSSLVWAVFFNYGILLFTILFIFDFSFYVIMVFNMFTTLVFFIIHFNVQLRKFKKLNSNEE